MFDILFAKVQSAPLLDIGGGLDERERERASVTKPALEQQGSMDSPFRCACVWWFLDAVDEESIMRIPCITMYVE